MFGALEHRFDAAGDCDVVVLDQHRIIKAEAVIITAAAANRIFLQRPQSRRRFARTDHARFGVRNPLDELRGRGGNAGQMTDEIKRGALGAENGARIARDGHQLGARTNRRSVTRMRFDSDIGTKPAK